jgi:hypothetical protein
MVRIGDCARGVLGDIGRVVRPSVDEETREVQESAVVVVKREWIRHEEGIERVLVAARWQYDGGHGC